MFKNHRVRVSSDDSKSEDSIFNNAFHLSSAVSTTFDSSSTNDSLLINRGRSPSLIIAAGRNADSTANTSIQSLQSTSTDGALDSDASLYFPNETLLNLPLSANHLLDKRLSTKEFIDCESSSEHQLIDTFPTSNTIYKSFRSSYSPKHLSENNNNIFKEPDKSADSQLSENSDSGFRSNAASNFSSKCPYSLPPYFQQLTTILEESAVFSSISPKKISGLQIIPLIDNLRKGPVPDLPQTAKFNETITTLAQFLDSSSRKITVNQLAQVLLCILQSDYSYPSEHSELSIDSFLNYADISKLSDVSLNNAEMDLDSIIRWLRNIYRQEENIDRQPSPDRLPITPTLSKTPQNTFKVNIIVQSSSGDKKKEYFPTPPFSNVRSNKENLYLQKNSRRETVTPSSKKSKVCFSSEVCQFSSFDKSIDKPRKKKYVVTPRFKLNEGGDKPKNMNTTDNSEDFFLHCERKNKTEDRTCQKNLRRSLSMSDILTEESTFEVSKLIHEIDLCNKNRKLAQKAPRLAEIKTQERKKKYKKRRSKSLENNYHLLVQTNLGFNNDSSGNNNNMPSTSGIQRKRFPNQNNENSSQKLTARAVNTSSRITPTQQKNQQRTGKNSTNWMSPNKNSNSRSVGIDSSLIAVSQIRKVFSPARIAHGPRERALNVPRIEITKSSPERCVSSISDPIMELHRKRVLHEEKKRKPWRP